MEARGVTPYNLIQPTISLEMPVPSQGHCGFPSFPVVNGFCLFLDLWVLPFSLEDCLVFGNFVITIIDDLIINRTINDTSLTDLSPPDVCAWAKGESEFPSACFMVFGMVNDFRWGVVVRFVDIGGFVNHKCLYIS